MIESWDDGVACEQCWLDPATTRLFAGLRVCGRCGLPAGGVAFFKTDATERHSQPSPPLSAPGCYCGNAPYDIARSCGEYSGAIEASVLFLKSRPHISPRLRRLIEATVRSLGKDRRIDSVVPVPLHRLRLRERGFNQARLIANIAARVVRAPVENRVIARTRNTERHRAGMDARDRARSVERAFKVVGSDSVNGASILLVDDLYTTGSTVSAAATTLTAAGAALVSIFTIARAVGRSGQRIARGV
jgi:ComF family protein